MKLYAVRRKSDGAFLNVHKYHTFYEPGEGDATSVPRLHKTKRVAICCLTQWLRGRHQLYTDYEEQYLDDPKPLPHRKKEDMEVVEVILSIKKNK